MGREKRGSCFLLSFLLFHSFYDAQNGGGCFFQITAGSDVSLGIDSWLLMMMSSPGGPRWPMIWMEVECVSTDFNYYYSALNINTKQVFL